MVHLGTPSREPMCAGIVGEGEGAAQGGPFKARQSSRSAAEEAIRKSKERCRFCGQPIPWVGRCPCPKKENDCAGNP